MSGMYIINDLHPERIEKEPIKNGFGRGLLEAGRRDSKIVALCADLTESTKMDVFAKEFPERYFEVGVAEQNLVTVASGMTAMDKIAFTSSYAAFSPGRNWEQIRTTVCLNNRNVKIVGSHAGVSVGPDGATHQMLEDIALMRVLPNMVVVAPADSIEAQKATLELAEDKRPAYLRLAREATPIFTTSRTPFDLNRAYVLKTGNDVSIIATGTMTYHALISAEILEKDGINAEVVHVPVIKPLDANTILASIAKTKAVVTAEEAQINGGFGSAVAEIIAENMPVPVRRIGMKDRFGESGTPDELMHKFGLSGRHIAMKAHELLHDIGKV